MAFVRKNAWNNGGTFENTDLLWYAKAVGEMKSRPISDPTSWWFYAAIHGQYLIYDKSSGYAPSGYPNWTKVRSIPSTAQLDTLPSQKHTDLFWNQCQHSTWFFPPWHRGYLAAIENVLRDIIVNKLKGPADWALPYWNYLYKSETVEETYDSFLLPVFTQLYLPDGITLNPLYVPERYGPEGNPNKVYVKVGKEKNDKGRYTGANDACQFTNSFTTIDKTNPQYGGLETGFTHYGYGGTGQLEGNPHNSVHNYLGGQVHIDDPSTKDFIVDACQAWQSTGINIKPNSTVIISFSEGGWTADPNDNNGELYDANGSPNMLVSPDQPLYPMVNIPMGALVGRVNGGKPFFINNDGSGVPDDVSGLLELCINDDLTGAYGAGLTDNQGSITVTLDSSQTDEFEGLMSDPGIAALDPVFYIHHANIDRLWAAWNETGNNQNSKEDEWLKGPIDSPFAMPMNAKGDAWCYAPEDVDSTKINYYNGVSYEYTYDNLALTTYFEKLPQSALVTTIEQRLIKLGGDAKMLRMATKKSSELVGASDSFSLNSGTTEITVQLDKKPWKSVAKSLSTDLATSLPNEIFLQIEGVQGINNANFLSITVNDVFVDSVSLFGIRIESMKNSGHNSAGLGFTFNISHIVDDMHLAGEIDVNKLNVQIKAENPIIGRIKIGRISVYRIKQ